MSRPLACAAVLLALSLACGSDNGVTPTLEPSLTPSSAASPTPTIAASATDTPLPATATLTPGPVLAPYGFPILPATQLGSVVGESPQRYLEMFGGPTALPYSRDDQVSADPAVANRSGWNCRVHVEYEGQPAVDWYVAPGTPVYATMPGTAHLYVVTATDAFDYYGVDREPYLGNPDRERAPLSPFPGPGGGKGIFIQVENQEFVTEYAHLWPATVADVPAAAFLPGYGPDTDYAAEFAGMRDYRAFTEIARWPIQAGDLIGHSGDTGYSEAPHLHYAILRQGSSQLLCPTLETGFDDGGWLFGP